MFICIFIYVYIYIYVLFLAACKYLKYKSKNFNLHLSFHWSCIYNLYIVFGKEKYDIFFPPIKYYVWSNQVY